MAERSRGLRARRLITDRHGHSGTVMLLRFLVLLWVQQGAWGFFQFQPALVAPTPNRRDGSEATDSAAAVVTERDILALKHRSDSGGAEAQWYRYRQDPLGVSKLSCLG